MRSLCLGPDDADGAALVGVFAEYLQRQVASGAAFDLTQAHVALLLAAHHDVAAASPALRAQLAALRDAQVAQSARLGGLVDRCLNLVQTLLGQ